MAGSVVRWGMDEKEPEVVHLEWERVQDPTREPPPEMVVAEPEPPKRHGLPRWNDPNPLRSGNDTATAIVAGIGAIVWFLAMRWAGLLGN
jgi:hypothetical protein